MATFALISLGLVIGGRIIEAGTSLVLLCTRGSLRREDARLVGREAKRAFLQRMLVLLCRACGIIVHVDAELARIARGRRHTPSLVLSNHVSYLDVVVLGSVLKSCFLAKHEVAAWPIVGAAGRALDMEFVDRERLSDRVRMLRRLRKRMRHDTFCVFPEGSTTRAVTPDATLWRRGQIWSIVPRVNRLVCVGLCYVDQGEIAWIDDMAFTPHLWNVLKRRETRVFLCARELPVASGVRGDPGAFADARSLTITAFEGVTEMCLKAHTRVVQFKQDSCHVTVPFVTEEVSQCNLSS